jgi:bifunctional DNase/RNase
MLIEMSIRGLTIDPATNMPIVILRDVDNQRALPIWVGPVEANAIALQVENVTLPRPMTHDLIRNLLQDLGVVLRRVLITDLQDGTFFAYLEIVRDGDVLLVDARPSDALALSLRTSAPIFVESAVLDRAKSTDVSSDQADRDRLEQWLESLDPVDLGYQL